MTTTLRYLRVTQLGKETVWGTPVPATAKLLMNDFQTPRTPGIYEPNQMIGLLAEQHVGVQTNDLVNHTWDTEFSFEQWLYAAMMGIKGGVTPTGAGAEKSWVHAPSAVGADSFDPYTLEKRFTDGTTNYDRQYPGTLAKSIQITGAVNGVAMMKTEMFSKAENLSAITGSLAYPTAWTLAPVNLAKLFIDTTWAGLGGTQITATNFQFSWTLATGLDLRFYMDGALGASRYSRMKREVTLQLTMDVGATSQALRAAMTSRAKQFIRVQLLSGTVITTNPHTLNLDGAYVLQAPPAEADRDGDDTIQFTLKSKYDNTGAQDFKTTTINTLAALP